MRQAGFRLRIKRSFDVIVAGGILCVTSPALLAVAGAIRWSMGRPVVFRQSRVGRGGRVFRITKFRTMKGLEYPGQPDSERTTRLGTWLRSTSIDELPQLLNVLKGDMSLVGPRPLLVRYLSRYSRRHAHRHAVLPGMTGWAQVNGRNGLTWRQKFDFDVWYVENWSPMLDFRILARTVSTVVKRDGVSARDHVTMPEFMGL